MSTCNPRTLQWLIKPCRHSNNIHNPTAAAAAITPSPLLLSLPDDILLLILSFLPSPSLHLLPLVSPGFHKLLSNPHLLPPNPTLHALLLISPNPLLLTATLHSNHHSTPLSLPLPNTATLLSFSHARFVPLGRCIYVLARGAALRYDTWTRNVYCCAHTIFPRKKFAAVAVNGKIYVAGGSSRSSAVEEYDPETDAWTVVSNAPTLRYGCVGAAANGVFYVAGGLRVGENATGARLALDAHVCAGSMDAYYVDLGTWGRGRTMAVPGGGCIVGACGSKRGFVYVVASHAVELSFWRWEGRGRGRGGEWTRLEAPPVSAMAGIVGGAVRFSCVCIGEERVVAIVNVSGRGRGDGMEGVVLVYDVGEGKWSRGPDLPDGFRRAALVCTEC